MTYRVRAIEVIATVFDDGRNSKSEANDDNRTGNEALDDPMGLKPGTGRGPEVSRD